MRSTLVPVVLTLALPTVASAHVALEEPPARYARDYVKAGPCGHPDNPSGEVVRTYTAGETITVRWDEFIGHPGHFRLALSSEGDGAFVDPVDYDDVYSAANVLLDDIEDPDGRSSHEVALTLPDTECDACVLQLIQVMTDKAPWGPEGGNELYYQCADIRIVAEGTPLPEDSTAGPGEESGGCMLGGRPAGAWGWLGLLWLAVGRRRSQQVL